MDTQLSVVERAKLENYEEIIKDHLDKCFAVGRALLAIREDRLYRVDFDTFEEYCKERWNLARQTAYQYIGASEVLENVRNCGQTVVPANEAQTRPLAKLPADEQPAAWQEAVETAPEGKPTAKHVAEVVSRRIAETKVEPPSAEVVAVLEPASPRAHVANNSGEQEWYTPAAYLDAAREVLGEFDLDPASSEFAQRYVSATEYYCEDDSGLEHSWFGRVWLNPPYSAGLVDRFVEKLCEHVEASEVSQAVLLVNNATETKWFQRALSAAACVCFPCSRIRFLDNEGNPKLSPLQGQAFLYFGDDADTFAEVFGKFGFCCDVRRQS